MNNKTPEIDLVYLWVDGNDPIWIARKQEALIRRNSGIKVNINGRYVDNDELKYSLRSVEKHLPWIRKIFIATNHQQPGWLNINHPKIELVNQDEFLPPEAIPCFNSVVIEYFIYRIPGLSDYFLYANDDMFVHTDLQPSYFFAGDGFPVVRLQYQFMQRTEIKLKKLFGIRINNYRKSIENALELIDRKYGMYYPGVSHHNIDAYRKDDFRAVIEDVFKDDLLPVLSNHFRDPSDIQRVLFHYYVLAIKHGHLKFVNRRESCRIRVQNSDFMGSLKRFNPDLFCLNDTERATDDDRARVRPFLDALYPEKSSFEK
ncbi:MAG: Stealth CR1 domain-containing protein [Paludibacter sp.]|nr:Stealth CR1 domain-containing protein [Paludibacter sp.]